MDTKGTVGKGREKKEGREEMEGKGNGSIKWRAITRVKKT